MDYRDAGGFALILMEPYLKYEVFLSSAETQKRHFYFTCK